jgi:excisionase family DNA binding protein
MDARLTQYYILPTMAAMAENGRIWMSVRQAAAYLGVSREWLRERRLNRQPPQFHRFGGRVRYVQADLEAWLEQTRGP